MAPETEPFAYLISADPWGQMTGKRRSLQRLIVAALFVVPTVVLSVSTSSAAPSKQEVEAARAKLDSLNRELDQLIELYNQAQVRLQQSEAQLAEAQHAKRQAEAEAARAMSDLSDRAVAAYTGMGSQLDVLLGAESLTEFSDRLQFMGALAQSDADLASTAETAGQQAKWAAGRYSEAVAARQTNLDELTSRKNDISAGIADQQALYEKLNRSYEDALAAQAAAVAAAEATASAGVSGGSSGGSDWGGFVPPPNSSAAQIAIAAAESVAGTQYVWGSADPNVGFDCSGLVLWSYAQAGIYLPHSSAMMYDMLPHLSQSELVAGDLLFFYSPVSHVSLYLGGGSMIDASHPGPGGEVRIQPVYWQYFVAGGRIG
jgi:cell wall-associated NlpC family hydrolase